MIVAFVSWEKWSLDRLLQEHKMDSFANFTALYQRLLQIDFFGTAGETLPNGQALPKA